MPMTISIDDTLKEQFAETCKRIGLTPSAAIGVFAKAVVRDQKIPFELSALSSLERERYAYEEEVARQLDESYQEYLEGKVITREESQARQKALRSMKKVS